jgi:hypothetical protein
MSAQTFHSKLTKSGSRVVLPIPFDPNEAWGAKDRHYVNGKIQANVFRGLIQFDGSSYFLSIGPAWLRDAHLNLDEELEVTLDMEGPLAKRMPEDIREALAGNPQAQAFFDSLPTFYRNNYTRWLESAKRAETRQARIREFISLLTDRKRER